MSGVNGTQWMLEAAKKLLTDEEHPPDPATRRLAEAVVELVELCRIACAERDRMALRLDALLREIEDAPAVYRGVFGDWSGQGLRPAPDDTHRARLLRIEEIAL